MSARYVGIILIVILATGKSSEVFKFPNGFELCHVTDSECLLRRSNEVLHNNPHGYPEIFLPSMEPFSIKNIDIKGNPNTPINFQLEMVDLEMYGYPNMTFTKFSGFTKDPENIKISVESTNEHVSMTGKYKISGRLLVFPIVGEGDINVDIFDLKIKSRMRTSHKVINGKTFLNLEKYKLHVDAGRMKVNMTNLFNGDPILSKNMLDTINSNWKILWDELLPEFNNAIEVENIKMFTRMLSKIPYEELFLKD